MCGEHSTVLESKHHSDGSSPRVWGTLGTRDKIAGFVRFIPTCVGNIWSFVFFGPVLLVHPHVCGEHQLIGLHNNKGAVHPHVCGEHFLNKTLPTGFIGSSPRVWGTCRNRIYCCGDVRFIPTCVGNIIADSFQHFLLPVHPHVCGEHPGVVLNNIYRIGSSPRVWGTYHPATSANLPCRFIPTCVGNMFKSGKAKFQDPVHPHVCGEHKASVLLVSGLVRFIPTCVGNIFSAPWLRR